MTDNEVLIKVQNTTGSLQEIQTNSNVLTLNMCK